jgi:multiple sugar transport system substrate-binding protein
MTEITFSIYGDQPSPFEDSSALLQEFQAQHHIDVRVNRMAWEEAWPKLLNFALYGGSPDISQIGAIWTSTLVAMNALRPFSSQEIAALGGPEAFFAPTWQNTMFSGRSEVWGIPFTAFTYIVLYRRDLLQRAGIAEQTAFESAEAMAETLRRLRAAGINSPWVVPSGKPYRARVHIAASWIWGAGGDFVSDDGRRVLFDQPKARAGIEAFFELYRYLSPSDYNLTLDECLQRFALGDAAVTIAGSSSPSELSRWNVSQVLENLGVAAMPGVPWIGGSNLVVWREAQMHPARQHAALLLANFLVSQSTQIKYAAASNSIPARSNALSHLKFEPVSLGQTLVQALRTGRAYKPTLSWVRMLNDLCRVFDAVTADILADATLDVNQALSIHLDPLAQRFNLMLSG